MPFEAQPQEVVFEHRRQGRCDAHREREGNTLCGHAVERVEKRQVTLDQRFVEPALLEVQSMLGMPHERKVRVQDEREVPGCHAAA